MTLTTSPPTAGTRVSRGWFVVPGRRYYQPSLARWASKDPIGEYGGVGLHVFVGNEPVSIVDPLGLARLSVAYEFGDYGLEDQQDIWLDAEAPDWTVYVRHDQDVLEDLTERFRDVPFDPKGVCGDCIGDLVLSNHGDGGGFLRLSNQNVVKNQFEHGYYDWDIGAKNAAERAALAALGGTHADRVAAHEKAERMLHKLSARMCEDARLTILMCNAGEGDAGLALGNQLKVVFGGGVRVKLFEGYCGWASGVPVTKPPFTFWEKRNL